MSKRTFSFLATTSVLCIGVSTLGLGAAHAAFEWTPPPKAMKVLEEQQGSSARDVNVKSAAIPEVQKEVVQPMNIEQTKPLASNQPVMSQNEQGEMVLRVPADSAVAQDLKEIVEQAEANNVITPVAELPVSEQVENLAEHAEQGVQNMVEPVTDSSVAMPPVLPSADEVGEAVKADVLTPVMDVAKNAPEQIKNLAEDVTQSVMEDTKDVASSLNDTIDTHTQGVEKEVVPEKALVTAEQGDVASTVMQETSTPSAVRFFGKDLPLITAVRQIVPEGVPYIFGQNVDLSQKVSWDAEGTWQDMLGLIAGEYDLSVAFAEDGAVKISNSGSVLSTAPVAADIPEPVAVTENDAVLGMENNKGVIGEQSVDIDAVLETAQTVDDSAIAGDSNQALEASLSDVVVISPVTEESSRPLEREQRDVMEGIQAGTVIKSIDDNSTQIVRAQDVRETDQNSVAQDQSADVALVDEDVNAAKISAEVQVDANAEILDQPPQNDITMVASELDVAVTSSEEEQQDMEDIVALTERVLEQEQAKASAATPVFVEDAAVIEKTSDSVERLVEAMEAEAKEAMPPVAGEPVPLEKAEVQTAEMPSATRMVSSATSDVVSDMAELADVGTEKLAVEDMSILPDELMEVRTWKVKKNSDLKKTLNGWAKDAQIELDWRMDDRYEVPVMIWADGTLQEAVDMLMEGYRYEKGIIPKATINMNDAGRPVLVVEPAV